MVYCILYSSVLGEPLNNAVGLRLRKSDSSRYWRVLCLCATTDLTAHVRPAQVYEAEVANSPGDCGSGCHNSGYLRIYSVHFGQLIFFNICETLVGWRTWKHPALLSKRLFIFKGVSCYLYERSYTVVLANTLLHTCLVGSCERLFANITNKMIFYCLFSKGKVNVN